MYKQSINIQNNKILKIEYLPIYNKYLVENNNT